MSLVKLADFNSEYEIHNVGNKRFIMSKQQVPKLFLYGFFDHDDAASKNITFADKFKGKKHIDEKINKWKMENPKEKWMHGQYKKYAIGMIHDDGRVSYNPLDGNLNWGEQ